MERKMLYIKASSLSDKAHKLLSKPEINKSKLVNRLLEEEADRQARRC